MRHNLILFCQNMRVLLKKRFRKNISDECTRIKLFNYLPQDIFVFIYFSIVTFSAKVYTIKNSKTIRARESLNKEDMIGR